MYLDILRSIIIRKRWIFIRPIFRLSFISLSPCAPFLFRLHFRCPPLFAFCLEMPSIWASGAPNSFVFRQARHFSSPCGSRLEECRLLERKISLSKAARRPQPWERLRVCASAVVDVEAINSATWGHLAAEALASHGSGNLSGALLKVCSEAKATYSGVRIGFGLSRDLSEKCALALSLWASDFQWFVSWQIFFQMSILAVPEASAWNCDDILQFPVSQVTSFRKWPARGGALIRFKFERQF